MPPDRGLANVQSSGTKAKKHRLTFLFTANANGSKKLPPLIIGKAHKPCAFGNKTGAQLGFYYRNNVKAWMTGALYQEWLLDWDKKLRGECQKILLLQDNFSGHIVPETLTNIQVINFEPNLTAHVQPNDQGIIRCFKAKYRAHFILRAIDRYEAGITPSQIYDIDQLEAMRIAIEAWNEVDTTTIRNCWGKANVLPNMNLSAPASLVHPSLPISSLIHTAPSHNQDDPIITAENAISEALNDLEATGALQHSNRMDVAELLNPAAEAHNFFEATDEDIYQAVMDARGVWEGVETESDSKSGEPIKPCPTHGEAVRAALVLGQYLKGLDDPFVRELDSMLGSFGKKTRLLEMQSKKDTKITDYFTQCE